jgi:hypothetical protein
VTVNGSRAVYSLEKLLFAFFTVQINAFASLELLCTQPSCKANRKGRGEERRGEEGPNRASDKRDK